MGIVLLLAAARLTAQETGVQERRVMRALRMEAEDRIELDGVLDEAVWERAEPATDFIQQDPDFGVPATERTEVRIVFGRENLYMGVICFDSKPEELHGYQRRRDEFLSADDRFMWAMDPYLDGRSGYFFEINPSGLMGDSLLGGAGQNNRQWDGIWTANVRKTDFGWVAEIEIPFRTLNFDPQAPAWGVNFQRTVRRKSEESLWTGHARNQGLRRMSNAGLLEGISDVTQGRGIELKPYALGTAFSAPGRNQEGTTYQGDVGLDIFYSPTPRLRTNFTLNTDFAQTEVDDQQVNLTRFSLFFDEKRDFFLEGQSFFGFHSLAEGDPDTRVIPFFSRRIGLSENREPQKIDYGTRLTGQVGKQDIGIMHVRTGPLDEDAGDEFTVARVRRRLLSQSYVGGLMTRRDPRGEGPAAYTLGLDALFATRTFLGSENLELGAYVLGASNKAEMTGDNYAYGVDLSFPNDLWTGAFSFKQVERNFDPDAGFVTRRGFRRYNPELFYSPRPENHPWIRRFSFGVLLDFQTDQENRLLTRKLEFKTFEMNTHADDSFFSLIIPTFERLEEDFEISEGITLPAGAEYNFTRMQIQGRTANRRKVAVQGTVEFGDFFSGTRQDYSFGLTLRARPGVIVYSEAEWNRVQLAEGNFQTRTYRLTPEWQFSPWSSLVNIFQYDNKSRVLGWQSRFRWIMKPGDDLYFVYTQNWMDDPALGLETLERRAATKFIYTHRF